MPDFYVDFKCLAGECPDTCCAGWSIAVDGESYGKYGQISDPSLRSDIMSNIRESDAGLRFVNKEGGRCAMLDGDGLCRIWKNAGEEMLCNTCRKFPKIFYVDSDLALLSLAASCPAAARRIAAGEFKFRAARGGRAGEIKPEEVPAIGGELKKFSDAAARSVFAKKSVLEYAESIRLFGAMLDGILDLAIENKEASYIADFFEPFEKMRDIDAGVILERMRAFDDKVKKDLRGVFPSYVKYRIFCRYLEHPDEPSAERLIRAFGEAALIYLIAFSRFCVTRDSFNMSEIICRTYRFCAHGVKIEKGVYGVFKDFFSNIKN